MGSPKQYKAIAAPKASTRHTDIYNLQGQIVKAFQAVCRIHADNHYFLVRTSPCQSAALFTFFIEGNS